jgi:hypothetical protein
MTSIDPISDEETSADAAAAADLRRMYQRVDLRMDRPTPARMYDYFLDGKDNFEVDRAAADVVIGLLGEQTVKLGPQENRAFLRRAVRFMAQQGVDQFIDLGAGLPTQGNVHQVAREVNPDVHVVYVDNDPIVFAHGRALLADSPVVQVITADLRRPDDVLDHPVTRKLIDFSRPVGLLMFAVLHFVPDDEHPHELLTRYVSHLTPGSMVGVSHLTMDGFSTEAVAKAAAVYERATSPMIPRPKAEIARIIDGLDLIEPGLVRAWQWRPGPDDTLQTNATYAAVAKI